MMTHFDPRCDSLSVTVYKYSLAIDQPKDEIRISRMKALSHVGGAEVTIAWERKDHRTHGLVSLGEIREKPNNFERHGRQQTAAMFTVSCVPDLMSSSN